MRAGKLRTWSGLLAGMVVLSASVGIGLAQPAGAAASPSFAPTVIGVVQKVDATTHIKKLNQDVTVPQGLFQGLIDLASGNLVGVLSLPPAHVRLSALGFLPLVDATTEIKPTGPIVGKVNFTTLQATTTSSFNINLTKLTAGGTNINLVGDQCTTSTPIVLTMSGTVDFAHGSTFSSTFTIPPFKNCGALTAALNQVMAGSGNTFKASFSPA